jgi:DNA sulfur modification protein DndB
MRGRHDALVQKQDSFYISMNEIITRILRGKIRLREISQPHVGSIKNYILTNLENKEVHIRPLVGHLEHGNLWDEGDISIIDGSHRLRAYVQLQQLAINTIERKDEQERAQALQVLGVFKQTVLPIQLHEGLTVEEQHQYYLELNSLNKHNSGGTRKGVEEVRHEKTLG